MSPIPRRQSIDQNHLKLLQPLLRARAKNDFEGFLDCYSDQDFDYCNFSAGKINLKKEQAVEFLRGSFAGYTVGEWRFTSIAGTREFCSMEGAFMVTADRDTPLHKKGESEEVPCVSLFRFDQDEKITMQHDYYCFRVLDQDE